MCFEFLFVEIDFFVFGVFWVGLYDRYSSDDSELIEKIYVCDERMD